MILLSDVVVVDNELLPSVLPLLFVGERVEVGLLVVVVVLAVGVVVVVVDDDEV